MAAESVLLSAHIQINNQLGKSPNDHSSWLDATGGEGIALMLTFEVPVVSLEITRGKDFERASWVSEAHGQTPLPSLSDGLAKANSLGCSTPRTPLDCLALVAKGAVILNSAGRW